MENNCGNGRFNVNRQPIFQSLSLPLYDNRGQSALRYGNTTRPFRFYGEVLLKLQPGIQSHPNKNLLYHFAVAKTHEQILESFEALLFDAITSLNKEKLRQLIDPNHVFVNETGETFQGIKKLEINKPEILRIQSIELQERKITLFNNVAIVNSVEMRTGDYRSLHFEREYSVTRVWKFSGRTWMLISTTVVLM